ncbi:MAG: hypothetical protein SXA11_07560 [Cyanobacteriota bacterium]|nr:hypothetical protein [Cyanobacteriota bacterium]
MLQFRGLQEGQIKTVERIGRCGTIHCISKNCCAASSRQFIGGGLN